MFSERSPQLQQAVSVLEMAQLVDPRLTLTQELGDRMAPVGQALSNKLPLYDVMQYSGTEPNDLILEPTNELNNFRNVVLSLTPSQKNSFAQAVGNLWRKAFDTAISAQQQLPREQRLAREELKKGLTMEFVRETPLDDLAAMPGISKATVAFLKTVFGDVETDSEWMEAHNQIPAQTPLRRLRGESLEERILESNEALLGETPLYNVENVRLLRERGTAYRGEDLVSWLTPTDQTTKGWVDEYGPRRRGFKRKSSTDPVYAFVRLVQEISRRDPQLQIGQIRRSSVEELEDRGLNRIQSAAARVIFDPGVQMSQGE